MFDLPEIAPGVRESLARELAEPAGRERLHAELATRDPEAASKININDPYRIVRALEILRSSSTNATLSSIRARFESQRPQAIFESIKIGLKVPRDMLRERVINRTQQMLRSGLIEEVESLCAQGLSEWAPLKSVGYAEVQMMLNGEIARAELEDRIVTSTMQLAKRQMTWFKRDADVRWVDASRLDLTLAEALTKLRP
jgi:tRNA dimethylallyltransferase